MNEKHLSYSEAFELGKQQEYEKHPKFCKYCQKAVSYVWRVTDFCDGICKEKYAKIEIKAQKWFKIKYRLRQNFPYPFHPQSSVKKSTIFSETIGVLSGRDEAVRLWKKARSSCAKTWVILSVTKVKGPKKEIYGGNHVLGFRDNHDGKLYQ